MEIFRVLAYDVGDGYGLSLEVPANIPADVVRKVAQELADQLNNIEDEQFPQVDGDEFVKKI